MQTFKEYVTQQTVNEGRGKSDLSLPVDRLRVFAYDPLNNILGYAPKDVVLQWRFVEIWYNIDVDFMDATAHKGFFYKMTSKERLATIKNLHKLYGIRPTKQTILLAILTGSSETFVRGLLALAPKNVLSADFFMDLLRILYTHKYNNVLVRKKHMRNVAKCFDSLLHNTPLTHNELMGLGNWPDYYVKVIRGVKPEKG